MDIASLVLAFAVALLGLAALALAASGQGSYSARRYQQAGALLSVVLSRRELVLSAGREAEETWLFSLAPGARLTVEGRPVPLEALAPGDLVEITYTRQEDRYLALEVAARGKPQAAARLTGPSQLAARPLV